VAFRKSLIVIISFGLILFALTAGTYAAFSVNATVNSTGTIVASPDLDLYSDSACTVPLTAINWGSITPGGTSTTTLYVKNTGGVSSTLSLGTTNWNPTTANGPLTISWNKQNTVLAPGQSTAATLTLTASTTITGITTFGVQIIISGTG
jgi:hypothetical protein